MPTNAPPIPNFPHLLNGIQPLTTSMDHGPMHAEIGFGTSFFLPFDLLHINDAFIDTVVIVNTLRTKKPQH